MVLEESLSFVARHCRVVSEGFFVFHTACRKACCTFLRVLSLRVGGLKGFQGAFGCLGRGV